MFGNGEEQSKVESGPPSDYLRGQGKESAAKEAAAVKPRRFAAWHRWAWRGFSVLWSIVGLGKLGMGPHWGTEPVDKRPATLPPCTGSTRG